MRAGLSLCIPCCNLFMGKCVVLHMDVIAMVFPECQPAHSLFECDEIRIHASIMSLCRRIAVYEKKRSGNAGGFRMAGC